MSAWIKLGRVGLALSCIGLLAFSAGCVASFSQSKRIVRYRPVMGDRTPWLWKDDGATGPALATKAGNTNLIVRAGTQTNDNARAPIRVLKRGNNMAIYLRDIPKEDSIQDAIDDNGNVNLPLIGIVKVEGKTTSEAEEIIEKAYINGGFYRKINVIVMTQDDEYFVRGEVKRQGRFPLSRDITLLQAITTAEGYTDFAKPSAVKIIRGQEELVFDAEKIEKRKEKDPLIKPSDIVVVPRRIFL